MKLLRIGGARGEGGVHTSRLSRAIVNNARGPMFMHNAVDLHHCCLQHQQIFALALLWNSENEGNLDSKENQDEYMLTSVSAQATH